MIYIGEVYLSQLDNYWRKKGLMDTYTWLTPNYHMSNRAGAPKETTISRCMYDGWHICEHDRAAEAERRIKYEFAS